MGYTNKDMTFVNDKIQELFKIVNELENVFEGRKFTLDGSFVDEEYITENHALMMYSPFISDTLTTP